MLRRAPNIVTLMFPFPLRIVLLFAAAGPASNHNSGSKRAEG
jgi:hypothetical protein